MNKKAFTLVELMGVITVLALISLLIAPTIINQIRNSKDKIDSVTEKLIYSATSLYLDNKEGEYPKLNGATYCLTLRNLVEDGQLSSPVLDSNGNEISLDRIIAVDVKDRQYSYYISNTCEKTAGEKGLLDLVTTSQVLGVNIIDKCATDGTKCEAGTAFAIKVNEKDTYKFYVLNDDGNNVTLIMNQNLGNDVAWVSEEDYQNLSDNSYTCDFDYSPICNSVGPITAINYLDELTDTEWSNIPKKTYTYSGITEDGKTRRYDDITKIMRARMLTYQEAIDAGCIEFEYESCSNYLYENIMSIDFSNDYLPWRYWTSTATLEHYAWHVEMGSIDTGIDTDLLVEHYYQSGVRPVIELSK